MWYWNVHHSSWPLWPCRYMEVIDWCTSSPSLGSWEIPLWCIHQSGTLSTKMNPKAMTLHISLPHSPRTTASYFAFSPFPSFYNFPTLKYMTSFLFIVINENQFNRQILKIAKCFDWHFYSNEIPIQNYGQPLFHRISLLSRGSLYS